MSHRWHSASGLWFPGVAPETAWTRKLTHSDECRQTVSQDEIRRDAEFDRLEACATRSRGSNHGRLVFDTNLTPVIRIALSTALHMS